MKSSMSLRAFVAALASAAFLWALTLSVSPLWHERIHSDASRIDHSCAVTFVSSGNLNHSPVTLLISAPVPVDEFEISELTPLWVGPIFLLASVFEHAPPVGS
jgi:hypothetical protein